MTIANTLTTAPIVIHNVMTDTYNTTTSATVPIYPSMVIWESPVTAADTFVITDERGNVKLSGVCAVGKQSQYFTLPSHAWHDWKVTVLDSGILYIYQGDVVGQMVPALAPTS